MTSGLDWGRGISSCSRTLSSDASPVDHVMNREFRQTKRVFPEKAQPLPYTQATSRPAPVDISYASAEYCTQLLRGACCSLLRECILYRETAAHALGFVSMRDTRASRSPPRECRQWTQTPELPRRDPLCTRRGIFSYPHTPWHVVIYIFGRRIATLAIDHAISYSDSASASPCHPPVHTS